MLSGCLLMQEFGELYGVSESTVYRALRSYARPKALRRADCGSPRIIPKRQMVHFCEVIAALQARHSNECWQFDLSPSDLKKVKSPAWMDPDRGHPLLMIYSLVDDRSGAAYQEYHGVYGEDVQAALRFLFNAMAPKEDSDNPFQGIPGMLYMDNGPITRSLVFQKVMGYLGIEVRTHMPAGKDGRRTTARSKGR